MLDSGAQARVLDCEIEALAVVPHFDAHRVPAGTDSDADGFGRLAQRVAQCFTHPPQHVIDGRFGDPGKTLLCVLPCLLRPPLRSHASSAPSAEAEAACKGAVGPEVKTSTMPRPGLRAADPPSRDGSQPF